MSGREENEENEAMEEDDEEPLLPFHVYVVIFPFRRLQYLHLDRERKNKTTSGVAATTKCECPRSLPPPPAVHRAVEEAEGI